MKRNKSRVAERRAEATARKLLSNSLSPKERLAVLDQRLGEDKGAVRERAKLQRLIDNPPRKKKGVKK